jgi:hypothetical protein
MSKHGNSTHNVNTAINVLKETLQIVNDSDAHPATRGAAGLTAAGAVGLGVATVCGVVVGWPALLGLGALAGVTELCKKKLG